MLYNNFLTKIDKKIQSYLNLIQANYNFDLGDEFEIAFCTLLSEILPEKYGVTRGFIIDQHGNRAGDDIIIYDKLTFPTIRSLERNNFSRKEEIPFEAVYAYIEAKHTLDTKTLKKGLAQIANVKKLQREPLPHTNFTPYIANSSTTINWPYFPNHSNPLYCMLIANTHKNDSVNFHEIIKQSDISNLPNLITVSQNDIVIPCIQDTGIVSFYDIQEKPQPKILPNQTSSLGIAVVNLLFALDRIRLSRMPWQKILQEQ